MTMFSTNPYFIIFQRFESYTALIVKELLYTKNQILYFYFKKCRTYNYNRNQHIKQHNKTILRYEKNVKSFCYCQKETV